MRELAGHPGAVAALAYSADGRTLASGGSDGLVKLWDPLTGRELHACLPPNRGPSITSLALSPDGRTAASGQTGGFANLWNVSTGDFLRQHKLGGLEHWPPDPTLVAFRGDGQRLATAFRLEIVEWKGTTDRRLRTLAMPDPYRGPCRSIAYSADGQLATGSHNIVAVWPVAHANNVRSINWPEGNILGLAFSRSGELAAARHSAVAFWFFDESRNRYSRRCELRHTEVVRAIACTSDGQTLLTAGDDWTVHVWDAASGQKRDSFNWRLGPILALAVAPDGMTAAAAGRDRGGILLWDLE